jgi:hypothetical protein
MSIAKEKLMRQKAAAHYLSCFNDQCPLHERCLRWEVGLYTSPSTRIITCVNPRSQAASNGQCDLFRDNQPVSMPVGMKNRFYLDMPAHTAQGIKRTLIAHNCRATYYKYHNGQRPIDPEYLTIIQRTCQEAGWQGPLEFDGETIDYVW